MPLLDHYQQLQTIGFSPVATSAPATDFADEPNTLGQHSHIRFVEFGLWHEFSYSRVSILGKLGILFMHYLQEQEEWDGFVRDSLGENAVLVAVSKHSSDCRIYKTKNTIFKIRRLTPSSIRGRNNSLEDEYLIMKQLSSIKGVPAVYGYRRIREWEQLEMELLPESSGYDPTLKQPRETFNDFWHVVKVTIQINRLGYSHGDLHFENVGRNVEGQINVFDFDQACVASPWRSAMRDLFGIGTCQKRSEFSLFDRLRYLWGIGPLRRTTARVAKYLIAFLRGTGPLATQRARCSKPNFVQRAMLQSDTSLQMLAEAWDIASHSNASAPGANIAYYSIDIGGIHLPGERPWILRWERIRKNVNFEGKRLLELGCNMGLLSIHAKLSGAAFCLGIDADKDILMSANLASRGFGADVEYRQLDLEDSFPWEAELQGFDFVSALSVLHWIKNKERAWSFISEHKEVLYEEHDSEQDPEKQLVIAGFTHIVSLGITERNRKIFYASRN